MERPCAPQPVVELSLRPVLSRDFGDDLLGEHVQGLGRDRETVEFAAADAVDQRRAFDEIVARQREQAALGRAANGVAGPADALEKGGDRTRRPQLADEVHVADIDPELERGGRHQRLQPPELEAPLGVQPMFLRHAAMVGGDRAIAEPLRQFARDALGHAAGVDEHQRRAVLLDETREAIVDLRPYLIRHHRFERRIGQFQAEVARALMPGVDDRRFRRGSAGRRADQKLRHRADRILGRGEADALKPVPAQRGQALEREAEMRAALVRRHGVDFVDDHRAGGRQHLAARLGAQQDVKRFGRGDEDVRRAPAHPLALGRRRIAGAHPGADLDIGEPAALELAADARQRRFEIAMNVVRQRLERRDIDDLRLVGQLSRQTLADEPIDRGKEGGERLAGAGRRGDQGVAAGLDRRPGFGLGGGRRDETVFEPGRDCGVEQLREVGFQRRGARWRATAAAVASSGIKRIGRVGQVAFRSRRVSSHRPPHGPEHRL